MFEPYVKFAAQVGDIVEDVVKEVFIQETEGLQKEVATLKAALKGAECLDVKVAGASQEEVAGLKATLADAERSAIKVAEAHQEEKADFIARENELVEAGARALNKYLVLKTQINEGNSAQTMSRLYKRIASLEIKLSNCHYWSSPQFGGSAYELRLIYQESCEDGCTNSE